MMAQHSMRLRNVWQRVYRGVDALTWPWRSLDDTPARAVLSPAAFALFRRMSKADRAHSLRLLRWLQEQGYDQPSLLAAALLHDVAKSQARLAVWQRTLKVLLRRFWPHLWFRLAKPAPPESWRYPFYVLQEHPALGATMAAEAGCDELCCWLIRYHETDCPPDPYSNSSLHKALQKADAAS